VLVVQVPQVTQVTQVIPGEEQVVVVAEQVCTIQMYVILLIHTHSPMQLEAKVEADPELQQLLAC
jgi:hypothetical protein